MKFKHKLLVLIMILAIACTQAVPAFAASEDNLDLDAQAAIVMDASTGKILYEKDAYSKRQPASTTKIVTCLLALEKLKLDQVITVKQDATKMGNIMEVKKGEELTVEQLLYALMVYSANDAAVVLAEEMGGTVENFAKMMDAKAKECGAKSSHFLNPNGLNWQGQEAHQTTAYDLAVMTREGLKDKTFRKLVSTTEYTIPATNRSKARKLESTNECLWYKEEVEVEKGTGTDKTEKIKFVPYYEGTIGVKTGLTSTAGGCFVGAVNRNGTELISVVLHSGPQMRFYDTHQMWDYALDKYYDTHKIVSDAEQVGKVRVKRGAHRNVPALAAETASVTVEKGKDIKNVHTEFEKLELEAPVKKGDKIGVIKVYYGDRLMSQTDAVAGKTIEEGGPLSYIGIPDWLAVLIYIAAIIIVLMIVILIVLNRRPGSKRSRRQAARAKRQKRREAESEQNQRKDV